MLGAGDGGWSRAQSPAFVKPEERTQTYPMMEFQAKGEAKRHRVNRD